MASKETLQLMTHTVIGYPSLAESEQAILAMAQSGANYIELQLPFSDPIADGASIMQANDQALANGVSPEDCFLFAAKMAKRVEQPIYFMSYYNLLLNFGVEDFCRQTRQAGIRGLIVPDLPVEEERYEQLSKACKKAGLEHIVVVSPNTLLPRLREMKPFATGFIYCTARTGTTGSQSRLNKALNLKLRQIRQVFKLPVAVGFGISQPRQIRQVKTHADIAVVGSALISALGRGGVKAVTRLVISLKAAAT